ncbi:hypothetical protein HK101_009115 [Irineochytrium annulatum]|nr:hypothetical protein HK101_009115 [Irineochytrium annulatum]
MLSAPSTRAILAVRCRDVTTALSSLRGATEDLWESTLASGGTSSSTPEATPEQRDVVPGPEATTDYAVAVAEKVERLKTAMGALELAESAFAAEGDAGGSGEETGSVTELTEEVDRRKEVAYAKSRQLQKLMHQCHELQLMVRELTAPDPWEFTESRSMVGLHGRGMESSLGATAGGGGGIKTPAVAATPAG